MKNTEEWIKNMENRWEDYICDKSYRRQEESGQKAILGELTAENIQKGWKIWIIRVGTQTPRSLIKRNSLLDEWW